MCTLNSGFDYECIEIVSIRNGVEGGVEGTPGFEKAPFGEDSNIEFYE